MPPPGIASPPAEHAQEELYETGRAGTAIVLMVKELEERMSDGRATPPKFGSWR
jgi:hypothetical protein